MGKPKIIVRIFKEYEYPKSMLHQKLFLEDAKEKAIRDIRVEMQELVLGEFKNVDETFFQMEAEEDRGFKMRNPFEEEERGRRRRADKVDLHKAIAALTIAEMEAKYGPLDAEKNPEIFDHEEAVVADGLVLREESFFLKEKIENEYHRVKEKYFTILSKLNK